MFLLFFSISETVTIPIVEETNYDFILFPAIFLIWHLPLYLYDWSPTQMNLPSVIQCGASPRWPLLEYLPSLGRGTAIHLRIGQPYISPADVRPSNGFGSLAYNKDAAVVVLAVAAMGRTHRQKVPLCILSLRVHAIPLRVAPMPAVRYDLNGGLPMCIRFIIYQEYIVIVYWFFCKPDMVYVSILVE